MTGKTETQVRLAHLEREAEQNRIALVGTIEELQSRVSPGALKEDLQTYVRERKQGLLDSLERKARENPLQTAAVAAAAAYPLWGIASRIPVPLLLIGAGFALSRRDDASEWAEAIRQRASEAAASVRGTVGRLSESASEQLDQGVSAAMQAGEIVSGKVAGAREVVSDRVAGAREVVSERVAGARDTVSRLVGTAKDQISSENLPDFIRGNGDWGAALGRNPLLVGAIGVAIGAAVAAALPSTRTEEEYLGDAAAALKQRAKQAASQGFEAAKTAATEAVREAGALAREEGLSGEGAHRAADVVSEKIRTVARNATASDGPIEREML